LKNTNFNLKVCKGFILRASGLGEFSVWFLSIWLRKQA